MAKIRKPSFYTDPEAIDFSAEADRIRFDNVFFADTVFAESLRQRTFSECIFENAVLRTDLHECSFTDVIFRHCDLSGASAAKSQFRRVRFENCRMTGADFTDVSFFDTVITESQCGYINFSGSSWKNCMLENASFEEGFFSGITFSGMIIRSCRFERTQWLHTPMAGLDLSDSVIDGFAVTPEDLKGLTVNAAQALACVGLLGLKIK